VQDVGVNFVIGSVAITNPGSCWVNFPQASTWIPPRQYGVIIPAPIGGYGGSVRIDLTQVPSAAYVQDLSDLTPALITFYEDRYPVSPGQSLLPFLPSPNVIPISLSQASLNSLDNRPTQSVFGSQAGIGTKNLLAIGIATRLYSVQLVVAAVSAGGVGTIYINGAPAGPTIRCDTLHETFFDFDGTNAPLSTVGAWSVDLVVAGGGTVTATLTFR
jgi:hypothetical protein